jgi:hypothetical protein
MGGKVQTINFRKFWFKKSDLTNELRASGLELGKSDKIVLMGEICSYCGKILPLGGWL